MDDVIKEILKEVDDEVIKEILEEVNIDNEEKSLYILETDYNGEKYEAALSRVLEHLLKLIMVHKSYYTKSWTGSIYNGYGMFYEYCVKKGKRYSTNNFNAAKNMYEPNIEVVIKKVMEENPNLNKKDIRDTIKRYDLTFENLSDIDFVINLTKSLTPDEHYEKIWGEPNGRLFKNFKYLVKYGTPNKTRKG